MSHFFSKKPRVGLHISAAGIRLAVVSGSGPCLSALSAVSAEVPAGLVNESYDPPSPADPDGLLTVLQELLQRAPLAGSRRTGLSLPDALFRIQAFDFDELPGSAQDRERLIRWRFEKAAAFDTADTVLRYRVQKREAGGATILACFAKRGVIGAYEELLQLAGLEPWLIGPASFHALDFSTPAIAAGGSGFAFASVSRGSFTTIVVENGGPRFYRYKEVKRSGSEDIRERLARELEDSVHFYRHADRSPSSGLQHLYLTGEPAVVSALLPALQESTSLEVVSLTPDAVFSVCPSRRKRREIADAGMEAALGAGGLA